MLGQLKDPLRFEGWSYRLLVRVCYAEAKRKPDSIPHADIPPSDEPQVRDEFGSIADRDLLERGLQQLSMDHRVVIVMRFLLDMSPEQVAETLGIPRRTVYSRLKRAVPAMRAALEADSRPATPTTGVQEVLR